MTKAKAATKSVMYQELANETGLSRKQVFESRQMRDAIGAQVRAELPREPLGGLRARHHDEDRPFTPGGHGGGQGGANEPRGGERHVLPVGEQGEAAREDRVARERGFDDVEQTAHERSCHTQHESPVSGAGRGSRQCRAGRAVGQRAARCRVPSAHRRKEPR